MVKCYKDLSVWQKAMELVEECYRITERFPRNEEFGLKSQMRRASVSIRSNIAEGNVRHSSKEYCRFIAIALGSTAELETQIELVRRLGLVSERDAGQLSQRCQEVGKMLNGLRLSISRFPPIHTSPSTPNP